MLPKKDNLYPGTGDLISQYSEGLQQTEPLDTTLHFHCLDVEFHQNSRADGPV
jgi:hypothetical protein